MVAATPMGHGSTAGLLFEEDSLAQHLGFTVLRVVSPPFSTWGVEE